MDRINLNRRHLVGVSASVVASLGIVAAGVSAQALAASPSAATPVSGSGWSFTDARGITIQRP